MLECRVARHEIGFQFRSDPRAGAVMNAIAAADGCGGCGGGKWRGLEREGTARRRAECDGGELRIGTHPHRRCRARTRARDKVGMRIGIGIIGVGMRRDAPPGGHKRHPSRVVIVVLLRRAWRSDGRERRRRGGRLRGEWGLQGCSGHAVGALRHGDCEAQVALAHVVLNGNG